MAKDNQKYPQTGQNGCQKLNGTKSGTHCNAKKHVC